MATAPPPDFGFEIDRFKEKPPDIFSCPVCTLIVRTPKECPTCGALFCSICVDPWMVRRKECPRSRCDIIVNPIRPIGGALLRIYNNLDIYCQFPNCKALKKVSDIEEHEKMCQVPKCVNFELCGNNVKQEFKDKNCCDPSCYLLFKIKSANGNWGKAYNEIKDFLKEYNPVNALAKPSIFSNPPKQLTGPPSHNNNPPPNNFLFKWDKNASGSGIELTNGDMNVFLREAAYMFRTIVGDTAMTSGVYYWEIVADDRTENELKIGITTKKNFNYNSAFCDYDHGYGYYGLGQLRHGSNAAGPQYGKRFKKEGFLGCFLDMNRGILSFSLNDEYFGVAYQNDNLKKGPIYPAISLLHCAGFKTNVNKPIPSFFFK